MSETQVTPVVEGNFRPQPTDTLAAIQARVAKAEAINPPETRDVIPEPSAPPPAQLQESAPVVGPKAPETEKADPLQKFRDKDGQVSEDKLLKSNEHLEKGIQEKQKLLEMPKEERIALLSQRNKELNKKFTQMSQEVAKDKPVVPASPFAGVIPDEMTPEIKQELLARLEKGEVIEVMAQVAKAYGHMAADKTVNQRMQKWEKVESEMAETASAKQIDSLVDKGHTWILTEGMGRFEAVFQEHPEIRNLKDPFRAAIGYMDDLPINGSASSHAQVKKSTPILGGSGAVPPPSSGPAMSAETEMQTLSANLRVAIQRGNRAEMTKIQAQMDKLERGY